MKNLKTKKLYVVYTGPDKQRRQENLENILLGGIGSIYFLHLSLESLAYMKTETGQ